MFVFHSIMGAACTQLGLYDHNVALLEPMADPQGRNVEIGYFQPVGTGYYALLEKSGTRWRLKEVSQYRSAVTGGTESLYVQRVEGGGYRVTPVYDRTIQRSRASYLYVCDESEVIYNPCNSAFANTEVMMAPKRRAINRDEIARAINQTDLLSAVDAAHRQEQQAGALAEQARMIERHSAELIQKIAVRVERVQNEPKLVSITPDDAQKLARLTATRTDEKGESFKAQVSFADFERVLPVGTVRCVLSSDSAEYPVNNVDPSSGATLAVSVSVEGCEVDKPHPGSFVADEKGQELIATIEYFQPSGGSLISLKNKSNKFVTVSSVSIYYFDDVITESGAREVPPGSVASVRFASGFPRPRVFEHVNAENAQEFTFTFGLAVKYMVDEAKAKTLLARRDVSVASVLPPVSP